MPRRVTAAPRSDSVPPRRWSGAADAARRLVAARRTPQLGGLEARMANSLWLAYGRRCCPPGRHPLAAHRAARPLVLGDALSVDLAQALARDDERLPPLWLVDERVGTDAQRSEPRQTEQELRQHVGAAERVAAQVQLDQLLQHHERRQALILDPGVAQVQGAERRRDAPHAFPLDADARARRLSAGRAALRVAGVCKLDQVPTAAPDPLAAEIEVGQTVSVLEPREQGEAVAAQVQLLERRRSLEPQLDDVVVAGVDVRQPPEGAEASKTP
eukprot:scaffold20396_cov101-Isochrysis_galbana.AAC.4